MNPYAPPRAPYDLPPPVARGERAPWTLNDVMGTAWRAFGANWAPLVFAPIFVGLVYITCFVAGFVVLFASGALPGFDRLFDQPPTVWGPAIQRIVEGPVLSGFVLGWTVVQLVLDAFFRGGLARMHLAAARGEVVRMGDLFSGASTYGRMLGLRFLVALPSLATTGLRVLGGALGVRALATAAGLLANLVSLALFVAMALGLVFAEYAVVDQGQGPIEALRTAFTAPAGERAEVFGLLLVVGLVAFAGLCCCGFGGIVSLPYASVCVAVLYTRLTNTTAPRADAT